MLAFLITALGLLFGVSSKNPLSIPFFGVYFVGSSAPDRRPPPKSLETKGSPVTQTFRTPDKRSIQMEARQNLGIHIDLSCCRNVQIVVRNRDPFAHTVGLELRLVDTLGSMPLYQTLGVQIVQSTPNGSPDVLGLVSQYETLAFPIPKSSAVKRFDEFAIRYHITGMPTAAPISGLKDLFSLLTVCKVCKLGIRVIVGP